MFREIRFASVTKQLNQLILTPGAAMFSGSGVLLDYSLSAIRCTHHRGAVMLKLLRQTSTKNCDARSEYIGLILKLKSLKTCFSEK